MQSPGTILENNFKNRFAVLPEPFGAKSYDPAVGYGRLPQL
jgi:hypothetical protein